MRKFILVIIILFSGLVCFSQTVAYPATFQTYAVSDCIDLTTLNSIVKGHQLNYHVAYYPTLVDAQNITNELAPFYSYGSFNEILYARVTNNLLVSEFATSTITINLSALPCCPPPPPGYITYDFCDTNNDGVEVAYLENLRYMSSYGYPPDSFCGLDESQIILTYYTSQSDAQNGTNPIDEIYTFSEDTEVYYKTASTLNSITYISEFGLHIENCTSLDSDSDGIDDADEDVNKNSYNFDDDTDQDGLKNFEDHDDDNDGILTIDEDYNGNGDPTDDDTNRNNVPDYLESAVTLSASDIGTFQIKLYPNPVSDKLLIDFNGQPTLHRWSIIDIYGKTVLESNSLSTDLSINVSNISAGIYVLKLEIMDKSYIHKFIKN